MFYKTSASMSFRSRNTRLFLSGAAPGLAILLASVSVAQEAGNGTGLPLPRFVSLKSDDVNVRRGPGQE